MWRWWIRKADGKQSQGRTEQRRLAADPSPRSHSSAVLYRTDYRRGRRQLRAERRLRRHHSQLHARELQGRLHFGAYLSALLGDPEILGVCLDLLAADRFLDCL